MKHRNAHPAISILLALCAALAGAAEDHTRLHLANGVGRVTVRGQVGGEQHDGYSLELPAGRIVKVSLSADA